MMSSQLRSRYDVIINGGGIVGFTLLNLILKSKHLGRTRVLLIEQAKKPSDLTQPIRLKNDSDDEDGKFFSNRVSSITYTSKSAFKKLGVWDRVKPYAKDIKTIKVWNYDYFNKITFKQDLLACQRHDSEEQNIVFSTLENNRLSLALLESISQIPNGNDSITWTKRLTNLEESLDSSLVDVTIMDPESNIQTNVTAPLVLGCDGYNSKVRELTGMRYKEIDFNKSAVVGTVKMAAQQMNTENDIAYQRFSNEKGTVAALLPLDSEYSSFVISAPSDYAKHLGECDEQAFVAELNQLLASRETPTNLVLKGLHEVANATYDNLKNLLQLVGPRLGLPSDGLDFGEGFDEVPSVERLVNDSRATFPLIFGTTSPRMVCSLPKLARPQIALLGDAAHRVHPLAGQGLNLGIQDAIELVKQLEASASIGERIFHDTSILSKALRKFELRRQAYVIPMSIGILSMQDLFKLAPSRILSSANKCQPIKTASVRFANGV
uniref:Putative ubiquinone biosynthesis monooxygenase coq-6 n=1 Tax=Aceria tosichella TaxID=561515 RepID=A0A6G1SNW7_9ACAR